MIKVLLKIQSFRLQQLNYRSKDFPQRKHVIYIDFPSPKLISPGYPRKSS